MSQKKIVFSDDFKARNISENEDNLRRHILSIKSKILTKTNDSVFSEVSKICESLLIKEQKFQEKEGLYLDLGEQLTQLCEKIQRDNLGALKAMTLDYLNIAKILGDETFRRKACELARNLNKKSTQCCER